MKKLYFIFLIFTLFTCNVQANLILNSGFETGLTNWQTSGNPGIRTALPLAYEGNNYITGYATPLFSVWQDINILDHGFLTSEIDSGNLNVEFGGWQSGTSSQQDQGQISIHLFDSNMVEIGNIFLSSIFPNDTWIEQSGTTDILSGTRFVRFEFEGTRFVGSDADAYLDATYLNISSDIPEPAVVWLFSLGLIGIFGIKRKSNI